MVSQLVLGEYCSVAMRCSCLTRKPSALLVVAIARGCGMNSNFKVWSNAAISDAGVPDLPLHLWEYRYLCCLEIGEEELVGNSRSRCDQAIY